MKASQAVSAAVRAFERAKVGDFRTCEFWEMSGSGNNFDYAYIHIGYAVNGEYTQSEKTPFLVKVNDRDGKIVAEVVQ